MNSTLSRKTPLARSSHPLRRSPLAKTSKKQRAKNREYEAAKKVVRERSGGQCEAVVGSYRCPHRAGHYHHQLMRSQGGKHTPENILHLCVRCHEWTHANPAQSYDRGLLIRHAREGM